MIGATKEIAMKFIFQRFVLIAGVAATLYAVALNGQHSKANSDPPAVPQAKTIQPATHFTQGTITSIYTNQLVITKKVRRKAKQESFTLDTQTQRNGNSPAGTRVSVQYREQNREKIAAAVRQITVKNARKPAKATFRGLSNSHGPASSTHA